MIDALGSGGVVLENLWNFGIETAWIDGYLIVCPQYPVNISRLTKCLIFMMPQWSIREKILNEIWLKHDNKLISSIWSEKPFVFPSGKHKPQSYDDWKPWCFFSYAYIRMGLFGFNSRQQKSWLLLVAECCGMWVPKEMGPAPRLWGSTGFRFSKRDQRSPLDTLTCWFWNHYKVSNFYPAILCYTSGKQTAEWLVMGGNKTSCCSDASFR